MDVITVDLTVDQLVTLALVVDDYLGILRAYPRLAPADVERDRTLLTGATALTNAYAAWTKKFVAAEWARIEGCARGGAS